MDKKTLYRLAAASWALGALALVSAGCVQSRPSRNGVFNENQYVRKDFLIRGGDGSTTDPGWLMSSTITKVSSPNPLGDAFISPGISSGGSLVRFKVTEDKLQMVNVREITDVDSDYRSPEILNAWGITNVDLKYRINLDGEITNFLEENQELDWQVRQWVKVKFAKNDMSDVAPFGDGATTIINTCTDVANSSATLVPGSFLTDDKAGYMEWTVEVTLPINFDNAACVQLYGYLGQELVKLGRQNVTFQLKYSMVRAKPLPVDPANPNPATEVTYQTLELGEKDAIRHKYGLLEMTTLARDNDTGLLAARELVGRFDPKKPIVWYFAPGFPDAYKPFFNDPATGMSVATSKLLKDAGATANVEFREWNDTRADPKWCPDSSHCQESLDDKGNPLPRNYGDIRYSFLVWLNDRDVQSYWAGVTVPTWDPRTGEAVSTSIAFNDFPIKDYYVQRVDAYLQTVGASGDVNSTAAWPDPGACKDGDVLPIVPATVAANHNGNSSLYAKMQQYLQKPASTYGNLGPQDFIWPQDDDFFRSYFAILPFQVFGDPDANQFVIREGGAGVLGPASMLQHLADEADFQQTAASIDRGEAPYTLTTGPESVKNATAFLNGFQKKTLAHRDYLYNHSFIRPDVHMDTPDAFSFEQIMQRDARHCINGVWETKEQWVQNLITTYWQQVAWHEFGHSMSLEHNFMASVDKNNFPHFMDKSGNDHIGLYASSVMEYNSAPDRIFAEGGWAPYDMGAISFAYGNNGVNPGTAGTSISGQSGAPTLPDGSGPDPAWKTPWADPHGFSADGKTEIQFLYCNENHTKYTPFCRAGDSGVTPSEIIANQIDAYEWQYHWRNFRLYRKFWDNSGYANAPAGLIVDMRRFIEAWEFDWSGNELTDTLRRIGIKNPDPNGSDVNYFNGLTNKFNADASAANQMVAAFHKAVIQQSSGERPFRTIYDRYYGDTTQEGIILDKLFAMQGFVALWPTESYDPNQAGSYFASYSGIGDSSYEYVAEDAVTSMVGGQYDVYPYFVPLAVAQFAQDTHSPAFNGRIEIRDWIGGHVFYRLQDFLDYFRQVAVENNYAGCADVASCTYDPRDPSISDTHNEFFGPDKRAWIWAYIPDRNTWVAVQKERNTASYIIVRNYTDDVVFQIDDGAFPGGAYNAELPMKFFLDAFNLYN